MKGNSKKEDFDFLIVRWEIKNKKLKERLINNKEWEEFPGKIEVRKTLDGFANVDKYQAEYRGEVFHAVSMRVLNPAKKVWRIYWLDTFSFEVLPQVEGERCFFGEEEYNGKVVKLRFLWNIISETTLHWNQAYFDESTNEWEINWTMDFTKI